MSPPFLDASIPDLVSKLRTEEKISLLSGPNWWNTTAIPRLGIPSIRMSDGPNGVRGSSHFVSTPAQCLPCATALGSTFDPELIHQVGVFLGQETKIKSSVILLAPTCNIQRNPLGGRSFESFSEDPVLSGTLAAAYVNGLQSEGVSATIKHFVGNDQEHERTAAESVISPRALREIYLYPFMLAQKYAKPGAYMTSYGRINGVHCSESSALLTDLLRKEWGFDGVVISDWHGTYGADQPINAGLDLEMPGPPRWRQPRLLLQCLSAQKLRMRAIDERVSTMLAFVQRQARRNPEVVYGDGVERSRDAPLLRAFCRKVAAEGMVLLRNEHHALPIVRETYRKIAVIGPGAKERVISGGGSAALKPTYVVTPWEGLKSNIPEGIEVVHELGCYAHKYLPTLENSLQTIDGEPGWICTFFNNKADGTLSEPVASMVVNDTRIKLNDFLPEGLAENWSIKLRGKLTAEKSCEFEFGLTVAGRAKLWIDGSLVIDNWTKQTPGDFFYGQGTIEEKASFQVVAGKSYNVYVLYTNSAPPDGDDDKTEGRLSQPALMRGVRLGGCEKVDTEAAIQASVKLAKDVDAVIFVGGLTPEWEAEGFDRPSLYLPGPQDELIRRLAEVNTNVIVCLQSGSAVAMPWVDQVGAIVQAWYSGNEAGNALADVIYGKVNPGGRLPLTFPVTLQDIPAYPNLHSENGQIHYREDLFVGYKHYQTRCIEPLFSFGFGLSYTIFQLDDLQIELSSSESDVQVTVSVTVRNIGSKEGSEVVQVYIEYPEIGFTTPKLQLRGFGKAKDLAPGQATELKVKMDRYGMAYWNVERHGWVVSPGKYIVHVGKSSEELVLKGEFDQPKELMWTGL